MYLLDFQRMTVEEIEDPKPPPGFRSGTLPPAEDPRNAGITFAVLGSPARRGDEQDEA
jgi:hypothetical protein